MTNIKKDDIVNITEHWRIEDQKALVIETFAESHVKVKCERVPESLIVPLKYVSVPEDNIDPFIKRKEKLKQELMEFDDPTDAISAGRVTKAAIELINYVESVNHKQI